MATGFVMPLRTLRRRAGYQSRRTRISQGADHLHDRFTQSTPSSPVATPRL
jgi:hypothetical protein